MLICFGGIFNLFILYFKFILDILVRLLQKVRYTCFAFGRWHREGLFGIHLPGTELREQPS